MKKSILLFSVFGVVLFSACKKEKNSDVPTPTLSLMNDSTTYDSFFVSHDEILGIAAKYNDKTFFEGVVEDINREIDNTYPINDMHGKPAFYVVNYSDDKGTVIFSADYRFDPVVYFSKEGNMTETGTLPNSFHNILNVYMLKIEALRYAQSKIPTDVYMAQYSQGLQEWMNIDRLFDKCCLHPIPYPGPTYDPCANFNYPAPYVVQPLITSRWRQGDPYNRSCPLFHNNFNCAGQLPWVGCVAVAVGQVVRYTQPTTTYNFDYPLMPDVVFNWNPPGEVERLLKETHIATLGNATCNYTASTTVKARQALNNDFGIPSAKRDGTINSNSDVVKARLREQVENGWPVILGGTTLSGNAINLPSFSNAHSWVLDGYRHETYCTFTRSFFHMNWGWGENIPEGWVVYNNWTPQGETQEYDLFLSMVYDIHN